MALHYLCDALHIQNNYETNFSSSMLVKFAPDYTVIEVQETLEGLELDTSAMLILI